MVLYCTYDLREQYRLESYIYETENKEEFLSTVKDTYLRKIYPFESQLFDISGSGLLPKFPRVTYRNSVVEMEFSKYLEKNLLMDISFSQDTMAEQYVVIIKSIQTDNYGIMEKFLDVGIKLFPNNYDKVIDYVIKRMNFFEEK